MRQNQARLFKPAIPKRVAEHIANARDALNGTSPQEVDAAAIQWMKDNPDFGAPLGSEVHNGR